MDNNEMISIREASKRIGMRPEYLRRQILKKQTPFKAWYIKTPSGTIRYYLPRKPFEEWLCNGNNSPNSVTDEAV